MPSLRARLVNAYIRRNIKRLPLHEMPPGSIRRAMNKPIPGLPKGVEIEPIDGAVKGEWHRPSGEQSGTNALTVLYFHGGGYVFGSPKSHRSLTFPLALHANARVFSLDYRLAPEHPCPAAIEDAAAAFQWLVDQGIDPKNIAVSGDSAGGGLALALMLRLRDEGKALPGCAVLYSPYTDLAVEGASAERNAESDAMFQLGSIKLGGVHYAGALDIKDPQCSPLYGEMAGLPPMLIFASTSEILYDDSTRLVEKAKAAGVEVEFVEEDGLVHVWPVFHPLLPEAKKTIIQSVKFMNAQL